LALHIQQQRLADTHEHMRGESDWLGDGPDVLESLFPFFYAGFDLRSAGASAQEVDAFFDRTSGDVATRFARIRPAWEAMRLTGYGEGVRLAAEHCFGLAELSPDGLSEAQRQLETLRRSGERLRLLRELAGLDHIQVDNFVRPCEPDASGPGFFLYDISWHELANGIIDVAVLLDETGVAVRDIGSLREAMTAVFDRYGAVAIAIKSQHAYERTLRWEERTDADAARALARVLADGTASEVDVADRLCLGDWCLARGIELATAWNLPIKLHTGYLATSGRLPLEQIRPGLLWQLLSRYPDARFVLMHIAYPHDRELLALAKNYANVWVDLCWAWSVDPRTSADFVRRFLHVAPASKLFAFGGDTEWPVASLGYAVQARRWLTRALAGEVEDDDLTEAQAMRLATRLMRENQYACFDVEGRRAAIHERLHGDR
jgi:uncharacterized protein